MGFTLITGANGGIGKAIAQQFAEHNHDLILVGRDKKLVQDIADKLRNDREIEVRVYTADLSIPKQVEDLIQSLVEDDLDIQNVVNNAGFGIYGEFSQEESKNIHDMQMVNMVALTDLTRALVPSMINKKKGGILNVASTAAFLPGPLMSVYYATKHYVLAFSIALNEELEGSGVYVSTLCPGPTESDFAYRASSKVKIFSSRTTMSAEEVAEIGYNGFMKHKKIIVPGIRNKMITLFPRFLSLSTVAKIVKKAQSR